MTGDALCPGSRAMRSKRCGYLVSDIYDECGSHDDWQNLKLVDAIKCVCASVHCAVLTLNF